MKEISFLRKENFALCTPKLISFCLFLSIGTLIFGYDTSSFSGVQAIPAYVRQFGELQNGRYVLTPVRLSLINSLAFFGKFMGTLSAGPLIERLGHRNTMYIMCVLSFIGVILEATSKHWQQFLVGRIFLYGSVGLTENAVVTYQAELVPAAMRGPVVASIQFFIGIGGLVASGVNRAFSTYTTPVGWLVPVCIQAIFPLLLCFGLWAVPPSPRWLISKRRTEEAIETLRKVRPAAYVANGGPEREVEAIQAAMHDEVDKGSWADLFRKPNLKRTNIAIGVFTLQQLTGQSFASQYGPRFYQTVGLGSQAFNYQVAAGGASIGACAIGLVLIEWTGRRSLLLAGGGLQAVFLYVMAGLGRIENPTKTDGQGIAACVIIFTCVFNATWGATPYVVASEIGTGRLREKTMAFSSTVNVVAAFTVSFTLPYLLNAPYAALGAGVGWIYGSFAVLASVYTWFFVPETKGRALEELDWCFEQNVAARKFHKIRVQGAAATLHNLEVGGRDNEKHDQVEELENGVMDEKERTG